MPNTIIPKRSTVASKVPTTSDLALGEIAINHADRLLYARHPVSGTVQSIGGSGGSQADWSATSGPAQILNKPTLATVATSGSYNDLTSKPTLGTAAATNATDYATAAQGTKADTASQPGHTHALSDLTQSSATSGQVPTWSGTAWVAQTPAAGGVTSVAGRTGAVTLSSSDVSGVVANGGGASTLRVLTQAAYNAISSPDSSTVYVITA